MSRDKTKQQTCYAIDACSRDQVIDIFEESFGYLSFVDKFVDRIRIEPIDYNTDIIASSSRPLIVLDIDNTILFVRFFSDEICVDDDIIYFHNEIEETSGIVTAVWYRLKLQISDDDLIDEYETDMIEYDHCHTLTTRIKKKKIFNYPYKIDEKTNEIIDSRETIICELTVIGCEIEYELQDIHEDDNIFHKFISFEEDSIEIENFLPSLKRKGYKDAAFVYDGFIVRIRNGAEDFLEQLYESWDIVFFTAANRAIYDGLMKRLHSYLCDIMGRDEEEEEPLWKRDYIYFRQDCTYDFDERGKIYHHKDLTKYNRDLSKVIIVDNSSLSYKSLEPNAILIKDFYGKDIKVDHELDVVLDITDQIIDIEQEYNNNNNIYIDYRYILTGIINADNISKTTMCSDLVLYDRRNPDDILNSTKRFLNDLKESLMQRGILPTTLKFGEPKNQPISSKDDGVIVVVDAVDVADDLNIILPQLDEEENDTDKSQQSLPSSITQEVEDNEGVATPSGDYGNNQNINNNDNDKEEIKEIDNDNDDKKESMHLALPQNTNKNKKRTHAYSISLQLKDIPNFGMEMDESDSKALGVILKSPALRQKFSEMNEREMRKNIKSNDDGFDDLDSESSDNNGIGSRMDDDTDDDEDGDSDWDDIEEEEDEEEEEEKENKEEKEEKEKKKKTKLIPMNTTSPYSAIDPALISRRMSVVDKNNNRRFTMKPRPDEDKIASGMSSVFLKRSVNKFIQIHENAQRRSSITKSSNDYNKKHMNESKGNFKFASLKDKFEQEIAHQTRAVRKSSLRGAEAKEELERVRRMTQQSQEDKEKIFELNIGAPSYDSYPLTSNIRPKPKKLIKRIDNPWVAKMKKEGMDEPKHCNLARVMREMPKTKKIPRRIHKKISVKTGDIMVVQEVESPIVEVTKRKLPPAPINKRTLPHLPGKSNSNTLAKIAEYNKNIKNMKNNKPKYNSSTLHSIKDNYMVNNNTMIIGQQSNALSFNMQGTTMSFSYTPPPPIQKQQKPVIQQNNDNDANNVKMENPPSLETIFDKKMDNNDTDTDSEDSLLQKMEQMPHDIDNQ